MEKQSKKLVIGLISAVFAAIMLFGCFYTVKSSERGVISTLGKVREEPADAGLHVKWPIIQKVSRLSIQTQKMVSSESAYTKDIQNTDVSLEINYDLVPGLVPALYRQVGKSYEDKLLAPIVRGVIKDAFGEYDAASIVANRELVRKRIENELRNQLEQLPISFFQNVRIQISNIDYDDRFEKAITDKQVAEQNALKAKNNTIRIEEEAKQAKIKASAEAEAIRIKSEALQKNPKITEYEAIQKWDGKLPAYMLGNSTPFINLGK